MPTELQKLHDKLFKKDGQPRAGATSTQLEKYYKLKDGKATMAPDDPGLVSDEVVPGAVNTMDQSAAFAEILKGITEQTQLVKDLQRRMLNVENATNRIDPDAGIEISDDAKIEFTTKQVVLNVNGEQVTVTVPANHR